MNPGKKYFGKTLLFPQILMFSGRQQAKSEKTYCFRDGNKPKARELGKDVRKSIHFLVCVKPDVSV